MKQHLTTAFVVLTTCLSTGCAHGGLGPGDQFRAGFHYTYDLPPGSRVELEGFNGPVEIVGWDQNQAEVSGERYASSRETLEAVKLEIRNDAHLLEIRARKPVSTLESAGVKFVLHVPRTAVLNRIVTSNGSVTVRDIDGEARVHTSNGPVRLTHMGASVEAETSNGAINASEIKGRLKLKSSNGPLRLENFAGECDAVTSNNSVEISLQLAPKEGIRVTTSNGRMNVRLPSDTGARVDATTSNGSVHSDFPIPGSGSTDEETHHLVGVIGAGGPKLDLTTSNGRINLLRR